MGIIKAFTNAYSTFKDEMAASKPARKINTEDMSSYESSYYGKSMFNPYNPDELVRKKGGLDIYDKMKIDEQVKATTALKINSIWSNGYDIQPGGDDEGDKEVADFIKHCLTDGMKGSFKRNFKDIMSCTSYGFSVTEQIHQVFQGGEYPGKIGLNSLKTRPPHSWEFHTDEHGNLVKLLQHGKRGPIDILPDQLKYFIIYSYNSEFGNYYGYSDLRSAYRPWWSKDIIIKFMNIYLERFGMGILVGKYPPGMGEKGQQDLLKIIKYVQAKTAFKIPNNVDISVLESQRRGESSYLDAVNYYDKAIAKAVLIPDKLGYTESAGGSYNLGEHQFELFYQILEDLRSEYAEIVMDEQLVKPLVDYNWSKVKKYPKFKFKPLREKDKKKLAEIFIAAVDKGIITETEEDEEYLRDSIDFPKRTPESKIIERPKPAGSYDVRGAGGQGADPNNPSDPGNQGGNPQDPAGAFGKDKLGNDKRFAFELPRELTQYEKKINFAQMNRQIDAFEYDSGLAMGKLITKTKDELISTIIRSKIIEDREYGKIDKLDLKYIGDMRLLWKDILRKGFKLGRGTAREEINKRRYANVPPVPGLPPEDALDFFEKKAFWLAGTEKAFILNKTKAILYDGVKNGVTNNKLIYNLEEFFEEYKVEQLTPQRVLMPVNEIPGRIEVIVRTNSMDAYNQGRMAMFRDPVVAAFVVAYQYSAIMDLRTSPICQRLDGKIYKANDPIWASITPPNHFQCRTILVPILGDENYEVSGYVKVELPEGFGK